MRVDFGRVATHTGQRTSNRPDMVKVMIVSREPRNSDALREFLRVSRADWGAEVLQSGEEAVTKLYDPEQNRPAMLFVDMLEVPDGKRLIEWVKMAGKTSTMPVIAIGNERLKDSLPPTGVDAILTTPLKADAVEALLRKFASPPPPAP